jgi:hypothetical protein
MDSACHRNIRLTHGVRGSRRRHARLQPPGAGALPLKEESARTWDFLVLSLLAVLSLSGLSYR